MTAVINPWDKSVLYETNYKDIIFKCGYDLICVDNKGYNLSSKLIFFNTLSARKVVWGVTFSIHSR